MAILREHLIDKVPVSEVCEKHGFNPTLFYHWQKKLFEEGAVVFDQPRRKSNRQKAAVCAPMACLSPAVRERCHPSYGNLVPFPAGLAPAEHARLT